MTNIRIADEIAAQKTAFYYIGLAFIGLKLLTAVIHWIHIGGRPLDAVAGHNIAIVAWSLGKLAPTLFCASFLVDAIILRKRTILFWSSLLAGAIALTIYIVFFYKR